MPHALFNMCRRIYATYNTACREQNLRVASDNKFALYSLKAQADAAVVYLGLQMAGVQWQGDNIHHLI